MNKKYPSENILTNYALFLQANLGVMSPRGYSLDYIAFHMYQIYGAPSALCSLHLSSNI